MNEGQPCYRLNEKKWRKFVSEEAGENHLDCILEVFGQLTDDRYSFTYYKLYEYNLGFNFNIFNHEKEN